MPDAVIKRVKVWEDGGASFMARVRGADGVLMSQASIDTITLTVANVKTPTAITTTTQTVTEVVFTALQTDSRWGEDTTGYNFRYDAPASTFATGDVLYRLEFKFEPASGENFHVVYDAYAVALIGS